MSLRGQATFPIGHHTVPQLYLRRFTDPALAKGKHGQVWAYPIEGGGARPESVRKATVVNDFYGPLEPVLGEVIDVAPMSGILDRLEVGGEPDCRRDLKKKQPCRR